MVSWSILYWDKDKEEIHMMEVRTNPGMTTSVELPDGTEVVLNSSSSLRYPSRFADDKREVKLVGEAFFSVAKMKEVHCRHAEQFQDSGTWNGVQRRGLQREQDGTDHFGFG